MGLDSSLYSIDAEGWVRLRAQREFRRRVGEMCTERLGPIVDVLPKREGGLVRAESLSARQRNDFAASMEDYRGIMRRVASETGICLDGNLNYEEAGMGTEVYDFGDDWGLYRFIVQNFWHEDGKANCVAIRLLEDDLERLVEFCGGNAGESPEAAAFAEAIEAVRDGRIVYYYPWY